MRVMRSPRAVDLEISSRCNLRCKYCYYLDNEGVRYRDLPTQVWLDLFKEFGAAQVMSVCLAGGEPFLREDIFELISGITRNRMRYEILTNGKLVTRQTAIQLKQCGRCNFVQVSLDGSKPDTHDVLRGDGSWKAAIGAIEALKGEGVPVTVRVTVHPRNVIDLPDIARLLLEEMGIPHFSTNSVSSLGTRGKYREEIFLSAADRLHAMRTLAALDEKYPGRILAAAGPLASWRMFSEMRDAVRNGVPVLGRGRLVGCGCVFNRLAVRADGAYVPCVTLPQIVLGHIGKDRLKEMWSNSPQLNALRARVNVPLRDFPECRGCEYVESCTGNCAGNAYSILGEVNRPSPDDCLRKFEQDLAAEGLSIW